MQEKLNYIKDRFKNAKFVPSCFKTIEDVENKILCDDDIIIIYDTYKIEYLNKKLSHLNKSYGDYILVKKRQGENHIYYKDVIDTLIENNFIRDDCDHRFLETISLINPLKRNMNSLNVYGFFWGS